MGDHTAVTSTQEQHPWRATIRTIVQVGIPAFLAFALVIPDVVEVILNAGGEVMPENLRAILLGSAAIVTAVAGAITRIMALPSVTGFIRGYLPWLAPDKPAAATASSAGAVRPMLGGITPDGSFNVAGGDVTVHAGGQITVKDIEALNRRLDAGGGL